MRSAHELIFRSRQELANLLLWASPPSTDEPQPTPLQGLPTPGSVSARLRSTAFHDEILPLAESVLQHRFPIAGLMLETRHRIEWRRDYRHNVLSDTRYFRRVPYLDFHRVGDHKVVWDLNRHQHLVLLAQAFLLTDRAEFLDELQRQIDGWLEDNPYMRGINWTSALEVGLRALSWIWVYHLVGTHLPENIRRRILIGLFQHGRYLECNLSVYFSPNTHLLGEAVALHALGKLFPSFPGADRWRTVGAGLVLEQMKTQVRDDGSHFEQSTYYHVYALDFFLFHEILADTTPAFRSKLWRMADYLNALMGHARSLPFLGDDDGGRMFHPFGPGDQFGRASVATAAVMLNESRWTYEERDLHAQAAWWLGVDRWAGRQSSTGAPLESRVFPDSGIAVMTSDALDAAVDAGPFGPGSSGHSHSDTLSLVVRRGAEEILVDSGTFTYMADARLRDAFRGSAAHNTIRIDGVDQAVANGPFRWRDVPQVELQNWTSCAGYDWINAICRYRHLPLTHQRQVMMLKGLSVILVRDVVEGPPGAHLVEQFWHPGEQVRRIGEGHFRIGEAASLLVTPEGPRELLEDSEYGWRSRSFGERTSTPVIVVRRRSPFPVTLWSALVTEEGRDEVDLRLVPSDREVVLELGQSRTVRVGFTVTGEPSYES